MPRLKSLQFGRECFCCCDSLVLESGCGEGELCIDLPELEYMRFDKNAFCFNNINTSYSAMEGKYQGQS